MRAPWDRWVAGMRLLCPRCHDDCGGGGRGRVSFPSPILAPLPVNGVHGHPRCTPARALRVTEPAPRACRPPWLGLGPGPSLRAQSRWEGLTGSCEVPRRRADSK